MIRTICFDESGFMDYIKRKFRKKRVSPMEQDTIIKKYFKMALIISGVIIGSLLAYLIVVEIFRSKLSPFTGYVELSSPQSIRYIFYLAAALQIVVIRLLRGVLLRAKSTDSEEKLVLKLFRASIMTSVLAEVPALMGLVLFFLGGFNSDFYILLFVSFFLVFMFFPRINNWKTWIRDNKPPSCCL